MTLIPDNYQRGINEAFEISRKEIDLLKIENQKLEEQLRFYTNIATEYAEFCVRCDRDGLPLIKLEDYISQRCK